MSKPRKTERDAFRNERMADIMAADAAGEGWGVLADKWGVSRPRAFQWTHQHAPLDVCERIGRNGVKKSGNRFKKRKYEYCTSHNVHTRYIYGGSIPAFDTCQRFDTSKWSLCGKPTKRGAQRCDECVQFTLDYATRKPDPGTVVVDASHPWRKPMKL